MVVSVRSLGLSGISGYEVTVECFLSGGLPAFDVVGLPDTAVREARERVRAAVKTCGARFPVSRITVNLAPAGQRKEGTVYDLPILLGLLTASEELPPLPEDAAFLGELSLTGALRPVAGRQPRSAFFGRGGRAAQRFGIAASHSHIYFGRRYHPLSGSRIFYLFGSEILQTTGGLVGYENGRDCSRSRPQGA